MSQFLIENLDFPGYLASFRAESTLKSGPFKVENIAQTLPKQLQNNIEKVQKTTFSTPKKGQKTDVNLSKSVDFWFHFRSTSSNFALLASNILQKSFPLLAKDILKMKYFQNSILDT